LRDIAPVSPSKLLPGDGAARAGSRITGRMFLAASAILHAVGFTLQVTYLWLDDLVRDERGTLVTRLLEEGTGSFGAFVLSGMVFLAWRAARRRSGTVWRRAPAFLLLGLALSVLNTSWMWTSRTVLAPLLGLGAYDYGRMPLRYLMEAPGSLLGFTFLLALLALMEEVLGRRARAAEQAELERTLLATQLQNLRLQLQPHFLFNALNTISATLHTDAALADTLLGRLADLLRASLRANGSQQVRLGEELALLEAYVALMKARFGDRLEISVDVEPGTADLLVPPFLLQPLVENAVRHGGLEVAGRSRVRLQVRREDAGTITFLVEDDGPGVAANRDVLTAGTGLSTTARRLALLHGSAGRLLAGNGATGGFQVRVTLPATTA
jgi:two-component system LytT family sensor kinase